MINIICIFNTIVLFRFNCLFLQCIFRSTGKKKSVLNNTYAWIQYIRYFLFLSESKVNTYLWSTVVTYITSSLETLAFLKRQCLKKSFEYKKLEINLSQLCTVKVYEMPEAVYKMPHINLKWSFHTSFLC
jgi:hypothetical protein